MRQFFGHVNEIGLPTYATFCIGTPGETEEEITATERFIEEIKPTTYDKFAYLGLPKSADYARLLETNDYYHIDAGKIVYSERFFEMAHRLYSSDDPRLYFLKQQKQFLAENKGVLSSYELENFRIPPMDTSEAQSLSSSSIDYVIDPDNLKDIR